MIRDSSGWCLSWQIFMETSDSLKWEPTIKCRLLSSILHSVVIEAVRVSLRISIYAHATSLFLLYKSTSARESAAGLVQSSSYLGNWRHILSFLPRPSRLPTRYILYCDFSHKKWETKMYAEEEGRKEGRKGGRKEGKKRKKERRYKRRKKRGRKTKRVKAREEMCSRIKFSLPHVLCIEQLSKRHADPYSFSSSS